MDIQEIYRIWDRFDQSDVTELELELEQAKFSLKRNRGTVTNVQPIIQEQQKEEKEVSKKVGGETESTKKEKPSGISVKAPLVGTYYCAPSPEADAFVKIGQRVKKGEVVALVEAMKLMNEVTAPVDGIVSVICVEDEQLVEFEQTLLILEEI